MKILVIGVLALAVVGGVAAVFFYQKSLAGGPQKPASTPGGSLWDLQTTALDGKPADLAQYKGKVALVVNVASKCGLTPQYEGLQSLYEEFAEEGLVVLGFPSNDFMGQEPGTPAEIQEFCSTKFNVTFPLLAKVQVKGDQKDPVYRFLTAGGLEEPTWNFTKYVVDREGKVLARFAPKTGPEDEKLRETITAALH